MAFFIGPKNQLKLVKVLCSLHGYQKKHLDLTESAKKVVSERYIKDSEPYKSINVFAGPCTIKT